VVLVRCVFEDGGIGSGEVIVDRAVGEGDEGVVDRADDVEEGVDDDGLLEVDFVEVAVEVVGGVGASEGLVGAREAPLTYFKPRERSQTQCQEGEQQGVETVHGKEPDSVIMVVLEAALICINV